MEVLEALQTRRSVRQFDPNYAIPKEELQQIANYALMSPTALNRQEIDLVVVSDRKKIDEACDIIFNSIDENMQNAFAKRKDDFGVKNVLTCDASSLFILVSNERAAEENFIGIDTGIMCMSIMAAARHFQYHTLCLGSLLWGNKNGLEEKLGIKKDSMVMVVAVGKALDGFKAAEKQQLCKATYID